MDGFKTDNTEKNGYSADTISGLFDDSNVTLTFCVLSDIHVEAQDDRFSDRFPLTLKAMTALSSNKKLDLICVAGDMTSATNSIGNVQWWKELSEEDSNVYNPIIRAINEYAGGTDTVMGDRAVMQQYYGIYERGKLVDALLNGFGTSRNGKTLSSVLKNTNTPKFFYSLGNHDEGANASDFAEGKNKYADWYMAAFMGESIADFMTDGVITTDFTEDHSKRYIAKNSENNVLYDYFYGEDLDAVALKKGNRHINVNGYNFLSVCLNEKNNNFSWVKEKLAEITKNDKSSPIFILFHFRPSICLGMKNDIGASAYADKLGEVLASYPQVITFGGHAHTPICFDNTFMQSENGYYSFDCGGMRYLRHYTVNADEENSINGESPFGEGEDKLYTGLLAEVDVKGNIRVTRVNPRDSARIGENIIIPTANTDGSRELLYTATRKNCNTAPKFTIAKATAAFEALGNSISVEFPKAESPNNAWRYELTVINEDTGEESQTLSASSLFYKNANWNYSEEIYNVILKDLNMNISVDNIYKVKIVCVDNWENKSEPIYAKVKL